jgi:hypothetical protein
MFALISNEELDALGQIAVKQLKNRFSDVSSNKKFVIGIDRARMRLADVRLSEQEGLQDANHSGDVPEAFSTPVFDNTDFGGFKV